MSVTTSPERRSSAGGQPANRPLPWAEPVSASSMPPNQYGVPVAVTLCGPIER